MSVAVANFLVFAGSQVGTPGPANMAMLASGAKFGLRRSLPFVAGVVLGKQLIIWPLGLGILSLSDVAPVAFQLLKYGSAIYIIWLAWKIANIRLQPGSGSGKPFSFWMGLAVHPLNPKAWALITAGFTSFVDPGTDPLLATGTIAMCLFATQVLFHPVWTFGGEAIAKTIAGRPAEKYLMWTLAILTVASVLLVLFNGGKA